MHLVSEKYNAPLVYKLLGGKCPVPGSEKSYLLHWFFLRMIHLFKIYSFSETDAVENDKMILLDKQNY